MKKKIALALILSMALTSFAGCSDSSSSSKKNKKDKDKKEKIEEISDDEDKEISGKEDVKNDEKIDIDYPDTELNIFDEDDVGLEPESIYLYEDYLKVKKNDFDTKIKDILGNVYTTYAITDDGHLVAISIRNDIEAEYDKIADLDSFVGEFNDAIIMQTTSGEYVAAYYDSYNNTFKHAYIQIDDELLLASATFNEINTFTLKDGNVIWRSYISSESKLDFEYEITDFQTASSENPCDEHGNIVSFFNNIDNIFVLFEDGTIMCKTAVHAIDHVGTMVLSTILPPTIKVDNIYGDIWNTPICIDDMVHCYSSIATAADYSRNLMEYAIPEGFDVNSIKKIYSEYMSEIAFYQMDDDTFWVISDNDELCIDEKLSSPELKGHVISITSKCVLMDDGNIYKYN